jgi:hypothetical protein
LNGVVYAFFTFSLHHKQDSISFHAALYGKAFEHRTVGTQLFDSIERASDSVTRIGIENGDQKKECKQCLFYRHYDSL